MKHLTRLAVLCGLFCGQVFAVELYKWTDKDGKVHYSDRQPPELKAEKLDIKIQSFTGPPVVTDWQQVLAVKPETRQVTIYTTEWCGVCKRAKAHMKKNKIAFKEFDIKKIRPASAITKSLTARASRSSWSATSAWTDSVLNASINCVWKKISKSGSSDFGKTRVRGGVSGFFASAGTILSSCSRRNACG